MTMKTLFFLCVLCALCVRPAAAQPAFPTNVVIALNKAGQVSLAWGRAASHTNVEFAVLIGVKSGTYNLRQSAGTNTTHTVTNLPAGATYYFVVIARNAQGIDSDPSNEVSQLIEKPAPTPGVRTVSIRAALESAPFPEGPWRTELEFPQQNFLASRESRFYRLAANAYFGLLVNP